MLILLSIVFAVLFLFLFLYIYPNLRNEQIRMIQRNQEEVVFNITRQLEMDLRRVRASLAKIVELPEFSGMDIPGQQHRIADHVRFLQPVSSMHVMDAQGWFISSSADLTIHAGRSYADQPFFTIPFEKGEVYFSPPIFFRTGGFIGTSVNVPIQSDTGKRVGVLSGGMRLTELAAYVTEYPLPEGTVAFLIDQEGTVVAHSAIDLFALEEGPLSLNFGEQALVQAMMEGKATGSQEYDKEGTRYLGSSGTLEPSGWGVVAEIPMRLVLAQSNAFAWRFTLVIVIVFAAAFLVLLFFARQITREQKQKEETIRESEERYRTLFQGVAEGILVTELETKKFKYANPAICKMLGYTEKELKGMSVGDVHPEENLADVISEFEAQARGEKSLAPSIPCLRKDGTIIYTDVNTNKMLIDKEECNVGFFTDITQRKKNEEELRESEVKYRSLFENMPDGFAYCKILLDENNRPIDFVYLEINDAFEKLTGLKRENVVGKKVSEAIPGTKESHPELFDIYGKVALTGKETEFDIYFKPLQIWLSISVYSPEKKYFVAVFNNITERKKAEEEIEALSRFPSENPNPVLRIARDGKVIYVNDAGKEVFKVRVGKKMPERYLSTLNEAARSKQQVGLEGKVGDRYFSSIVRFIPEAGYFNMYSRDITERKRAQEVLREYSENLEQMVEERTKRLRDVQEELVRSERLAILGQVSGGISHELRNPLGVIDSSAYYLKMKLKDTDPKVRKHLDRIESSVAKATGIIESLLKMTQMREPSLKELDLIAVTSQVIVAFKMPVAVKLVENFPKEKLRVRIDRRQFEIVIEGIINNAIQAMGGKGTLTVGISRTADGQAEVSFADTGPGIAPEDLDRIFQPLFSTKARGIGLGLSIAKIIIDKHGGKIEAKSELGKGAILIIQLPLYVDKGKEAQNNV